MKNIVLIEDDPHLTTLIKIKLEKEGYRISTAADGADAVNLIQQEKPDILLLDFELPSKNGLEILEEIRNRDDTKTLPVIVLSNSGSPIEVFRFQKLGVKDYFIKADLNLDELVKIIQKYEKNSHRGR